MTKKQDNEQEELELEREKLKNLGVKGTWDILSDLTKKKKEE